MKRTLQQLNAISAHSVSRRELFALPFALGITACVNNGTLRRRQASGKISEYSARLDELRERLPEVAEYAAETIPGFQVACILDGEVTWSKGYGTCAKGSGHPVDADTVFDLGSLTKPLFTAAVMRLRDRRMLDLDAPLISYFDYPDVRGQDSASKVTARHVLSHTTGLPNWRPFTAGAPLKFLAAPGNKFGYSGEGFFWLQRVVEEITGVPAARLVRQEVLDPLRLARSSLVFESRFESNYAQGHRKIDEPAVDSFNKQSADRARRALRLEQGDLQDVSYAEARRALIADNPALAAGPSPVLYPTNVAGALQATASDYARFMTAFMAHNARSLLSAATAAEMLTPQSVINRYTSYGLGWRVEQTRAGKVFWHSGYNDGFHSFALGDPAGRFGVVVLTNSDRGDQLRWPVVHGATGFGSAAILS